MSVILHVEDDPAHAFLVTRVLKDLPVACQIKNVTDGVAALDYLNHRNAFSDPTTSPRPAVVLLDLHLPKLNGFAVLKSIKEDALLCDIPVIILTTSDHEGDRRMALSLHANNYIAKPSNYTGFSVLIEDLSGYLLN